MIKIRRGIPADLEAIMTCYDVARQFMRNCGNESQWINGYPGRNLVAEDIKAGVSYVGEDESGEIVMTFAFIIGDDPTYMNIYEGEWINDMPYGTIHRLGSNGKYKGMLRKCVDYCFLHINNLRLDTHADNTIMQHGAERLGFTRCGIIHCMDGSPRIAYQKHRKMS